LERSEVHGCFHKEDLHLNNEEEKLGKRRIQGIQEFKKSKHINGSKYFIAIKKNNLLI
jgi:hypothetical protein